VLQSCLATDDRFRELADPAKRVALGPRIRVATPCQRLARAARSGSVWASWCLCDVRSMRAPFPKIHHAPVGRDVAERELVSCDVRGPRDIKTAQSGQAVHSRE